MQKTVLNGLYFSGFHRLIGLSAAGDGAILTFHRVRADRGAAFAPNAHLEITPEFLEVLVKRLRREGRDIVTLDEAMKRLAGGSEAPFAVLTFDDGYRDNLEVALPVLQRLDAPFTVYVATGMIDRAINPWWLTLEEVIAREPRVSLEGRPGADAFETRTVAEKTAAFRHLAERLASMDEARQRQLADAMALRYGVDPAEILDRAMMDWDEVRELAANPLVTIGAHTVGHYALAKLPLAQATREVTEGARILAERVGIRPRHFSYPYGYRSAAGEREFGLLAELGFATAVRTVPGTLNAASAVHPTALPRISMNGLFQRWRYAEVLLSGAPFALAGLANRALRRDGRPAARAATAVASSR